MRGYMSAIAYKHNIKSLPDPTDCKSVKMAIQGVANTEPYSTNSLKPIDKVLLHRMVGAIPFCTVDFYERKLIKALFLLTYYACLRAGEIVESVKSSHTLHYSQLVHVKEGLGIKFLTYKHSRSGRNKDSVDMIPLYIVSRVSDSEHCPLMAMGEFTNIRGNKPGPVFIHKDSRPVQRHELSKWLKCCIELCETSPVNYNTHSFRIGRATQLADEGFSDDIIRAAGRWKTNAFKKYIKRKAFIFPR